MKLASKKTGRDGALLVVSGDLDRAVSAHHIAPTLQAALDDWSSVAPKLSKLYDNLQEGVGESFKYDPTICDAPLPRAYQWLDASAYVNHVSLVRQARGVEIPETFWTDPLMYQGGSDKFLGPNDPIIIGEEAWGTDFEAELGIVVDEVPIQCSREEAAAAIRLFVLINDVSLRNLLAEEIKKNLGFVHAKPSSSFAPVAVTPDELGDAWDGGRLHLPMLSFLNGKPFGCPDIGTDMTFDFPELIMHAAKTRPLGAGTIIGSGTISNRDADGGSGRPISDGGKGYSCIAEVRTVETILNGKPSTPFMRTGDHVEIEIRDRNGASVFGRIDQSVVAMKGR